MGGKDYARGTNFTCMATSGDGFVVVGSSDGRIRLYNSKTLTQVGEGCWLMHADSYRHARETRNRCLWRRGQLIHVVIVLLSGRG